MELYVDYGDEKYMIYYCCEGGDEKYGGFPLPTKESLNSDNFIDDFMLSDDVQRITYKIKYEIIEPNIKKINKKSYADNFTK